MIPKIIHCIWLQGPEHFQKMRAEEYVWSQSLQKHFPEWEYRLWSKEEIEKLIRSEFSELLPLWEKAPNFAFSSDLGRIAILFKYGGMYIDTDYIILKPFDHLFTPQTDFAALYYDNFSPFDLLTVENWKHNNCFMASCKESPIIRELIEGMIKFGAYQNSNTYTYTTQCSLKTYDRVIKKHALDDNVVLISHSDLEPLHALNQNARCKDEEDCRKAFPSAYAIHMGEGSWIPGIVPLRAVGVMYGFIRDYWQIFAIVLIVLLVIFVVLFAVTCYEYRKLKRLVSASRAMHL